MAEALLQYTKLLYRGVGQSYSETCKKKKAACELLATYSAKNFKNAMDSEHFLKDMQDNCDA